jgi:hypothetical protein
MPYDSVQPLIEGYQNIDPRLYDILKILAAEAEEARKVLFPISEQLSQVLVPEAIPFAPTIFTYSTTPRTLVLTWNAGVGARAYELRKGTSWTTATQITIVLTQEVRLDPIIVGTTRYLLKSINGEGEPSNDVAICDVIITPIGSITLNGRVIDNNVLLSWSLPTSVWEIDYFRVLRDGSDVGLQRGTFAVFFESVAGLYTYTVIPVDLAGNQGPSSSVTLEVNQPPDFELQDYRKSLLSGYKENAWLYGSPELGWVHDDTIGWDTSFLHPTDWSWESANTGKLLVCIDLLQTWGTHFTNNSWDQIQDQITEGYPIYIQPNLLTAKYREVINYGTVLSSNIVNVGWTLEQLVTTGIVSATSTLESSLDGINWSTPVNGKSAFFASFQFVRITVNFTADNKTALAIFSNLSISLDVKWEIDSGHITSLASDVGGTTVLFNVPFKDVDSITVSADASEPVKTIFDFLDVPNPVSFKVAVYDETGQRTTYQVSWKARGIV